MEVKLFKALINASKKVRFFKPESALKAAPPIGIHYTGLKGLNRPQLNSTEYVSIVQNNLPYDVFQTLDSTKGALANYARANNVKISVSGFDAGGDLNDLLLVVNSKQLRQDRIKTLSLSSANISLNEEGIKDPAILKRSVYNYLDNMINKMD